MGGGGGGSYFSLDPERMKQELRRSESVTSAKEVAQVVEDHLQSCLPRYNDRDTEAVGRHIDEIAKALEKELAGTVDLRFGGSVAKRTYVNGLSDVDALVLLDSCELAGRPPHEAKTYFAERLRARFPNTEVEEGRLAVTVNFSDVEVQLLPAVSCGNHVKISDPSGKEWAAIRPRKFAEKLSAVNREQGRKVVPVVKLAKAMIATLPEQQQISGYHAESLAVNIFRGYDGPRQLRPMLKHFFSEASKAVLQPVHDSTGQSVHVDDALGGSGSLERRIVSSALNRVSRRMHNADLAQSAGEALAEWRRLFEPGV